MRFANKLSTYTCYSRLQSFSPIHYPDQLDDTGVDGVESGMTAAERNGLRFHTRPALYLLSDIYTVFYCGVS